MPAPMMRKSASSSVFIRRDQIPSGHTTLGSSALLRAIGNNISTPAYKASAIPSTAVRPQSIASSVARGALTTEAQPLIPQPHAASSASSSRIASGNGAPIKNASGATSKAARHALSNSALPTNASSSAEYVSAD